MDEKTFSVNSHFALVLPLWLDKGLGKKWLIEKYKISQNLV